eukprot:scaffold109579_cov26-Tisochrysis_lutea.AAC.2
MRTGATGSRRPSRARVCERSYAARSSVTLTLGSRDIAAAARAALRGSPARMSRRDVELPRLPGRLPRLLDRWWLAERLYAGTPPASAGAESVRPPSRFA